MSNGKSHGIYFVNVAGHIIVTYVKLSTIRTLDDRSGKSSNLSRSGFGRPVETKRAGLISAGSIRFCPKSKVASGIKGFARR